MSWHSAVRTIGSWDMEDARTYTPGTYGESNLCALTVPNYGYGGQRWNLRADDDEAFAAFVVDPVAGESIPGPRFFPASQLFGGRACVEFTSISHDVDVTGGGAQQGYSVMSPNLTTAFSIPQPYSLAWLGYPGGVDALFAGGPTVGGTGDLLYGGFWGGVVDFADLPPAASTIAQDLVHASLAFCTINGASSTFNVFARSGDRIVRQTATYTFTNPGPCLDFFIGLYFPTLLSAIKLHERAWTENDITRLYRASRKWLWASNPPAPLVP